MKNFYFLTLFLVIGLVGLSAQTYDSITYANSANWYLVNVTPETKATEFEIAEATDEPAIDDDEIDAEIWDATPWYPYQVIGIRDDNKLSGHNSLNPVPESDVSIMWKAVWDEGRIYWLIKVTDDTVFYDDTYNTFWAQDCFEFYFIPHNNPTLAVMDNDANRVQRDDSTKSIFHVIMSDFEGNPVKLANNGNSDATSDGWKFAGGQTDVYLLEGFAWREENVTYFKIATLDIAATPAAVAIEKSAYEVNDILMWEATYNEQDAANKDADGAGNRAAFLQVAADSGEASGAASGGPRNYAKLKLVEEIISISEHTTTELSVYPNPATNEITLSKLSDVEIFSVSGQMVLRKEDALNVNISSLKTGVYFVKAQGQVTKLVVK